MKKPFQTYNGGKEADGTFQKIINLIPPHDIYIEGFLGNGTIYRYKKPASWSIGIEKDTAVVYEWFKIKENSMRIVLGDAINWLNSFLVLAGILKTEGYRIFIYLDPPYPKSTWKSQNRMFTHEMTDEQHRNLLHVVECLSNHCNIMISSYPNEMYDSELADWHTTTFQSQTRNGLATEKLYMNYPAPAELHDYRYLGSDYRERERIKGIIKRNVSKFKRMPTVERNAFINHLKENKII